MSQLFFLGRKNEKDMVKLVLRNTRHGGQAKYSGNKPSKLGEIALSITITLKIT